MPYASSYSNRGYVLAACSVAILFVVASWRIAEYVRTPTPTAPLVDTPALQATTVIAEPDSDSDGVPDWQETLLGTNTETPDAAEAQMRLQNAKPQEAPKSEMADKLMDRLITAYTGAQLSGNTDQKSLEAIANDLSLGIQAPGSITAFSVSALKTTPDTSLARITQYQNEMRKVMEPMLGQKEPEIAIYGRYVANKDEGALAELKTIAATDEAVARALMKVVVPANAASKHVDAANALLKFANTLSQMAEHAHDPITSLALLRSFNDAEKELGAAFGALGAYYAQSRTQ